MPTTADGAVALAALDATAVVKSLEGEGVVPLVDLYLGVGKSTVDSRREILTHIRFQALDTSCGEVSAFERLAMRKTFTLPVINAAVSLKLRGGRFESPLVPSILLL
jgi:carbon-monoxide dehydrogenase medium subunit